MGTSSSKTKRSKTLPRRRSRKKARDVQVQPLKRSKSLLRRSSFKNDIKMELDLNTRRRSLSDGQLTTRFQDLQLSSGSAQSGRTGVEVAIPAREIKRPSLSGYLDRRAGPLAEYESCWCVLKDNTLYRYAAPIDDVTQDVLQLPGYEVRPCIPTTDQKYLFELGHQEYPNEMFNAESATDLEEWMAKIHLATHKLTLESLSLENSSSLQFESESASRKDLEEEAKRHWQKELLRLKKQQLLQEVLQQKEELTRKQNLLVKSKQSSLEAPYPPGMSSEDMSLNSDHGVHEQLLRERAMLKQRKISTQLNLEMIQKQLGQHPTLGRKHKKRGFKIRGFKSDKGTSECNMAAPVAVGLLESQARELTDLLEMLDKELEEKERRIVGDSPRPFGGRAAQRRRTFAAYTMATSEHGPRSGNLSGKGCRSFPSDSHLQRSLPADSVPNKPTTVSQNALFPQPMDVNTKVQLMSYTKLASSTERTDVSGASDSCRSLTSRHSWDLGSIPYLDSDVSTSTRFLSPDPMGSHTCSSFHKSCDLSRIGSGAVQSDWSRGVRPGLPRSASDSTNLRKAEISAAALAEIAAFEELVQEKLSSGAT